MFLQHELNRRYTHSATLFSTLNNLNKAQKKANSSLNKEEAGFILWINFELSQLENKLQNNFILDIEDFDTYEQNYQKAAKLLSGQRLLSFEHDCLLSDEQKNSSNGNPFLNSPFPYFRSKVQKEFETGRFALKSTVNLTFDIILKDSIISMFISSYSEWWLRFGLEVLSGQYFPSSTYPSIKAVFITVIFGSNNLVPKLDFSQAALFYCFLIVYLLDFLRSQMDSLKFSAPLLLFQEKGWKTSHFMFYLGHELSSIDILKDLCERTLQSQGDIIKQFSFYGANFTYNQKPSDELPYQIFSLSSGLRDGVQLSRLLAQITNDNAFILASRKTQSEYSIKIGHISNMNNIFSLLEKKGVSFQIIIPGFGLQEINSKDITDGHQQKTISLLWKLICSWKVPLFVSHASLQKEIHLLYNGLSIKKRPPLIINLQEIHSQLADASVGHLSLLFEWSWIIGEAYHNISVENFTSSFVDGRILSAILLHYKPRKSVPQVKNWMEFFISEIGDELPLIISPDSLLENGYFIDEKKIIFLLSFLSFLFLKI